MFASFMPFVVVIRTRYNLGYLGASVKHLPQPIVFSLKLAIPAL